MAPEVLSRIVNASKLVDRLGRWPSFHDAQILSAVLNSNSKDGPTATFSIHVWNMLSETDERGYYRLDKHTLVELRAAGLLKYEPTDFNQKSIIFNLDVTAEQFEDNPALRLTVETSYGPSADILTLSLEVISVQPCDAKGNPEKSS
jgi:hypothetical protein